VAFLGYDALSDLTLAGLANEALRAVIFVGPVLLYLRYVEKARATKFLRLVAPFRDALTFLPLAGAASVAWYLLLDRVVGDGSVGGAAFAVVLFTILSPTTLIEEVYFRGFSLNKFWQTVCFWKANAASSAPFVLIHLPGWFALGRFVTPFVLVDALGIFVSGLVFGWAMKKTGSLWPAYALHALNNLLVWRSSGPDGGPRSCSRGRGRDGERDGERSSPMEVTIPCRTWRSCSSTASYTA
jgi:membrane protease YdiL (CAAX protease family)